MERYEFSRFEGFSNVTIIHQMSDWKKFVDEFGHSQRLVLAVCSSNWAQHFISFAPFLETLIRDQKATMFLIIDCDDAKEVAEELKISEFPTFIFFKEMLEMGKRREGVNKRHLQNTIDQLVADIALHGGGAKVDDKNEDEAEDEDEELQLAVQDFVG